jgi:signal transduction histidine kinase
MTESVDTYANARDEAREMMLAVLSHDLRNPLMGITMSASALLKSGRLDPAGVGSVSRIARAADHITRLINDLLDLARSRFGGNMPVNLEWLDLSDIASQAVEELRLAHPDRDIVLESQTDVRGRWDRDRMLQLVSNLVANAIRHGRDPIRVDLHNQGDIVEIRITNRGTAIPPEFIPKLFEPYRRGSEAKQAGLGLGLFIVAEIVRAHAGMISVQSDDQETAFVIRLPKESPA